MIANQGKRTAETEQTPTPLRRSQRLQDKGRRQPSCDNVPSPKKPETGRQSAIGSQTGNKPGRQNLDCENSARRSCPSPSTTHTSAVGSPRRLCHVEGEANSPEPANPDEQKNHKHRLSTENGDTPQHDAKRPKPNSAADPNPTDNSKNKFVRAWLNSTDDKDPFGGLNLAAAPADNMPAPLTYGDGASTTFTSSSRTPSVKPYDPGFREALSYRDIYIDSKEPPLELIRRANEIVTGPRLSPEVDEATGEDVKRISRLLGTGTEESIIQELAPSVIPRMRDVSDRRLNSNKGQLWTNVVPVPLNPSVTTNPLPLSRSKPDNTFGYSQEAFTRNQLDTINYIPNAIPDRKVHFPFLGIEFKAMAKGGTHTIAANQAASAGAIAGYGLAELARRSLGPGSLDHDEPQFFSLSMDNRSVFINVHWLSAGTDVGGQRSFHMEGLSMYDLRKLDDLKALQRAVKNILDWGLGERLSEICKQLDTHREKGHTVH